MMPVSLSRMKLFAWLTVDCQAKLPLQTSRLAVSCREGRDLDVHSTLAKSYFHTQLRHILPQLGTTPPTAIQSSPAAGANPLILDRTHVQFRRRSSDNKSGKAWVIRQDGMVLRLPTISKRVRPNYYNLSQCLQMPITILQAIPLH